MYIAKLFLSAGIFLVFWEGFLWVLGGFLHLLQIGKKKTNLDGIFFLSY